MIFIYIFPPQYVIFPVALKGEDFLIERPADHGGNATFPTFEVSWSVSNQYIKKLMSIKSKM